MNKFNKNNLDIFAIAVISADGYVARFEKDVSLDWASKEDTQRFVSLTKKAGAVVMGRKTFWATPKPGWPLPKRMNYVLTRDIEKVWSFYESDIEREKLREKDNLVFTSCLPAELISLAEKKGYSGLAICGGTSVYTSWLPHIKTLYLTRETRVELNKGKTLFSGMSLDSLNRMLEKEFDLVFTEEANSQGTVFEEWCRKNEASGSWIAKK